MNVLKRNGTVEHFDPTKIIKVLQKSGKASNNEIKKIVKDAVEKLGDREEVTTAEIQKVVEEELLLSDLIDLTREYIQACYQKRLIRDERELDKQLLSIIDQTNEEVASENSNKDTTIVPTQRDYMAGEVNRSLTERILLPPDVIEAHKRGEIHFHDSDFFALPMTNCGLPNLKDMFENGTVISGVTIDPPKSLRTAATIATQIVALVSASQYGGQSISLAHLAPYVDVSRKKIEKRYPNVSKEVREDLLHQEIVDAVQTIQYQTVTLATSNGQAPFLTVFLDLGEAEEGQEREDLALLIEEVLRQRIKGVKNEAGQWVAPAFPKLIYTLREDNIHADSKYYYLTEIAAECTAKRMVPDYISAKVMNELKGDVYPAMGCRSFLTPDEENHKYYGRFNAGVVTINLPYVALKSGGDIEKFYDELDKTMELTIKALKERHKRLYGTKASVAPILWMHGAYARLDEDETIDKLLFNNYSTLSMGYAGLHEAVTYLTGFDHDEEIASDFARDILKRMNDCCDKYKELTNISFSLYGTPLESTTQKFANACRRDFGEIEGITDHDYITNSYHIHVKKEIDAFSKLEREAYFQELSPGGAISYVEIPDMSNNIPAVIAVLKHIYNTIMYAELNSKFDACHVCGYEGEISGKMENGVPVWKCPKCGNMDQDKMTVVRRTCGYIGSNFWNKGRSEEIFDRVLHL